MRAAHRPGPYYGRAFFEGVAKLPVVHASSKRVESETYTPEVNDNFARFGGNWGGSPFATPNDQPSTGFDATADRSVVFAAAFLVGASLGFLLGACVAAWMLA